jgi:hypothetical protein
MLLVGGVALVGLAALAYRADKDTTITEIVETDKELNGCFPDHSIDVSYQINNFRKHTVRVVGLSYC